MSDWTLLHSDTSYRGTDKKFKRCGYCKSEKNALGYKTSKVGCIERLLHGENKLHLYLRHTKKWVIILEQEEI